MAGQGDGWASTLGNSKLSLAPQPPLLPPAHHVAPLAPALVLLEQTCLLAFLPVEEPGDWHLLPTLPGCWHESLWASYPFAGDCFVGGCVPPSGHRDVRAVGGGRLLSS